MHKSKLLVCRVGVDNEFKLSRPCVNCIELLEKMGIKKVYYTEGTGTVLSEKISSLKSGGGTVSSGFRALLDGRDPRLK